MAIRKRPEMGKSKKRDDSRNRTERNERKNEFPPNLSRDIKSNNSEDTKRPGKVRFSSYQKTESKPVFRNRKDNVSDENKPVRKYTSSFKKDDNKTPFNKKRNEEDKSKRPARTYSSGHSRNLDTKRGDFKPVEKYDKKLDRKTSSPNRFSKPTSTRFKQEDSSRDESREKRPATRFSKTPDREKTFGKRDQLRGEENTERRPSARFSKTPDSATPYARKREESGDDRKSSFSASKPRLYGKSETGKYLGKRENAKPGFGPKGSYKAERKPTGKSFDKDYRPNKEAGVEEESNENVRLNRYISNAGICSRREADKLISAGLVSVNSKVITELGYQVKNADDVRFNGQRLSREKKVYILMNKPKDAIATLDDPEGRNTVLDLLGKEVRERVFPVGRLDRNTTGVLLLTNDGEMAQRLMHPKYEVEKVYKATLNKPFKGEDFWQLSNGIELEDGFIKPDEIAYPDPKNKNEVGILIHSGRNRIIHRMFEHLGYSLDKLDRVSYGGFVKTGLKRGDWRPLNEKEITKLKRISKLG